MSQILTGKLAGVYQEENNFYARFNPSRQELCEVDIPITSEQFHSLKLKKDIRLIVEFVI